MVKKKRQKWEKRGERGFFLLETIVLAAMLAVMTGGLVLYRQGLHLNEQTRFEAAAVSLAESELAYLEYDAKERPETFAVGSSERSEYVPFSTRPSEGGADFRVQREIGQLEEAEVPRPSGNPGKGADSAGSGAKAVYLAKVRVSWQDRREREQSVTLQRVICP